MTDIWDMMKDLAADIKPSASKHTRVVFKGVTYRLIGSKEYGGALATDEQFEKGECSFAHLQYNGEIWRFHEKIGDLSDLTFLDEVAP